MEKYKKNFSYLIIPFLVLLLCFLGCTDSGGIKKTTGNSQKAKPDISPEKTNKPLSKSDLENEVYKLLKGDQINLRRDIDKVFKLISIYIDEGEDLKAIKLYESALLVNAANLNHQLQFAKLLSKHDRVNEAITAGKVVYNLAEDEDLIEEAKDLLNKIGVEVKVKEEPLVVENNIQIILIPLGNPNIRILKSVSKLLEQKMGIKFLILNEPKKIGNSDRTLAPIFIKDYYKWLEQKFGEEQFLQINVHEQFAHPRG